MSSSSSFFPSHLHESFISLRSVKKETKKQRSNKSHLCILLTSFILAQSEYSQRRHIHSSRCEDVAQNEERAGDGVVKDTFSISL